MSIGQASTHQPKKHERSTGSPLREAWSAYAPVAATMSPSDLPQTLRRSKHVRGQGLAAIVAIFANSRLQLRHTSFKRIDPTDQRLDEGNDCLFSLSMYVSNPFSCHAQQHEEILQTIEYLLFSLICQSVRGAQRGLSSDSQATKRIAVVRNYSVPPYGGDNTARFDKLNTRAP
jgi:hypothetical protein